MALRRYLILGEETERAHCPDWYALMQAAKYLGIPVPDIIHVPIWWIQKALVAMTAEAQAQEQLQQQAEAKARSAQNGRY